MKSPFPQDWKEYTIGDCLRRVEHPVEVDSDALYTQIGIRSHGKGLFYKEPVTGESLGNKAVYWIEPDCFILNIVFAWEQAIGKTTQAEVGMIGSHRFPMYKPVNNLVDIDYLVYYLLTKRGTDILEAASPGGAGRNRTLGQGRFLKSKIVLPPLDEQKKIAEILSTQDKAIELQARKIEELKRFKKGCLEKMFPRKGQKVPEKRFPGFTDDWEQRKLGDIASDMVAGGDIDKDLILAEGQYPVIANALTGDGIVGYYDKEYRVNAPAVTVTGRGDVGHAKARLVNFTPVVRLLSVKSEHDVFFLENAINTLKIVIESTGVPQLTVPQLAKYEVAFPRQLDEEEHIGAFFKQLDNLITLHQRKLEEMKNQKKALIQLLLTGIVKTKGEVR